ncbi:hypothetical protein AgCh_026272 [Apium graveolens]
MLEEELANDPSYELLSEIIKFSEEDALGIHEKIIECNALPSLVLLLHSEDATIHREAVNAIENLVHSSPENRIRALEAGALQPVIRVKSENSEIKENVTYLEGVTVSCKNRIAYLENLAASTLGTNCLTDQEIMNSYQVPISDNLATIHELKGTTYGNSA